MPIVTLEQMRKMGPSKGMLHHLEKNEENCRSVEYVLDALACDMGIIARKASEQLEKSYKGESVRTSLNVLYELERKAEMAVSLMKSYMGSITFIEEAIPAKDLEDACV